MAASQILKLQNSIPISARVALRLAAILMVAVMSLSCSPSVSAAEVANLRCEDLKNPLGIDLTKPQLSWVMEEKSQKPGSRAQKQTAYQVLVASSPELLARDNGDLWDSGKVGSDRSLQVEYAGKALASRMRCTWKVRVWDRDGKASAWSQPALWTMGVVATC